MMVIVCAQPQLSKRSGPDGQSVAVLPSQVVENALREQPLLRGLLVTAAGFTRGNTAPFRRTMKTPGHATLVYCVRGGGWCEAGGQLHAVRRGDLLVLPPAMPHACGAHASNPWTVHWAEAVGELLPEYLRGLGGGSRGPLLHIGEDPQVIRLFNETFKSLRHGTSLAALLQASHAFAYLLSLLIAKRQERPAEDAGTVQKVAEAIIYMSEHLEEPLRVSALARAAGFSPAYFSELFKDQTGCSPRDYLHLLRIHSACQLLEGSSLSVKEIATRIGYQDPFHFSRQFKAFQGVSPSEYRQSRPGPIG